MGSLLAALVVYGVLADKKNFDFIQYDRCFWKSEIGKNYHDELIAAATRAISEP